VAVQDAADQAIHLHYGFIDPPQIRMVPRMCGIARYIEMRRPPMTTETMTVTAPDISCEHCQHAIETAVGSLAGVQSVTVDIPTKRVNVAYDPGQVAREQIEATLDEEGYPVQK
jgi:copper ion binding protein